MTRTLRLDLTDRSRVSESEQPRRSADAREALAEYGAPPGYPVGGMLTARPARRAAPPRQSPATRRAAQDVARREKLRAAYQEAWGIAFGPGRGLLPAGFMLWVAGNSAHLFSVTSVIGVVFVQMRGLLAVRSQFRGVLKKNPDLVGRIWLQMAFYVAVSLVGVGGALYKCMQLGLLPTEESDWVGLLPPEHLDTSVLVGVSI